MGKTVRIGTRQLLRDFKKYKESLVSGVVQYVILDLGNGDEIELSHKRSHQKGTAGYLADYLDSTIESADVRRPNLDDSLLPERQW